jgi:ElaA protein
VTNPNSAPGSPAGYRLGARAEYPVNVSGPGITGTVERMTIRVRSATPAELDSVTAYRILKLRVDVFVVEQDCAYPELDGRDLEPDTLWVWATDSDKGDNFAGEVVGTLRILAEPDGTRRIGRVATAVPARSSGVATALMRQALELCDGRPVVLDAQTYTEAWYQRFGFVRSGADFVEDGIPHVPMTLKPAAH